MKAVNVYWHVDGDRLYMEAVQEVENDAVTLDKDVVILNAWMAQRMTGAFSAGTPVVDTNNPTVAVELRKFGHKYLE